MPRCWFFAHRPPLDRRLPPPPAAWPRSLPPQLTLCRCRSALPPPLQPDLPPDSGPATSATGFSFAQVFPSAQSSATAYTFGELALGYICLAICLAIVYNWSCTGLCTTSDQRAEAMAGTAEAVPKNGKETRPAKANAGRRGGRQ